MSTFKQYINDRNSELRGSLRLYLSIPIIYSMIIPFTFLYIAIEIYQQTAFRLYGITITDGRKFLRDRRRVLPYLSWTERLHCWYCQYMNGILALASHVAQETEKMWCPIQNQNPDDLPHRKNFAEYGNEQSLQETLRNQKL